MTLPQLYPTKQISKVIPMKPTRLTSAFLLFALSTIVSAQPPASSERAGNSGIDLIELIKQVAVDVDKEFILDPRISGISVDVVSEEVDYETLLAYLRINSLVAIENDNQIMIAPDQGARSMATRILQEDDSRVSDHEVVTRIIRIPTLRSNASGRRQNSNGEDAIASQPSAFAATLVPVLRPMMSTSAQLGAVPGTNTLILVDRYDNVRRITAVIEEIIDQMND
jgi:general secretion pathway protein D